MTTPTHLFDGDTIEPDIDNDRLSTQLERVRELMSDGQWRTLAEIASVVGGTEAAVSARLRDLRKERFGSLKVDRRRVTGGLFQYRLDLSARPADQTAADSGGG